MHVAHALYRVAYVFERARCTIHFQVLQVHSASPKRCEIFIRAYAQNFILKRVCVPALLRARKQHKNFNSQNRKKQYFSTQIAYNRPVKIYKANNCMKNDKRRRFLSKIASVLTAFRLRPYRVRLPCNSFFFDYTILIAVIFAPVRFTLSPETL